MQIPHIPSQADGKAKQEPYTTEAVGTSEKGGRVVQAGVLNSDGVSQRIQLPSLPVESCSGPSLLFTPFISSSGLVPSSRLTLPDREQPAKVLMHGDIDGVSRLSLRAATHPNHCSCSYQVQSHLNPDLSSGHFPGLEWMKKHQCIEGRSSPWNVDICVKQLIGSLVTPPSL